MFLLVNPINASVCQVGLRLTFLCSFVLFCVVLFLLCFITRSKLEQLEINKEILLYNFTCMGNQLMLACLPSLLFHGARNWASGESLSGNLDILNDHKMNEKVSYC